MVKIPVTESGTTQLTTRAAIAPITPDTRGKSLQVAGRALEESASFLYKKMDDARNYTEAIQYEGFKIRKMAELKVQATNDTYTDSEGRVWGKTGKPEDIKPYREMMKKDKEEAGKIFSNKEQQAKAMADWDMSSIVTENAINNTFMKNVAINGDVIVRETLDSLVNTYDGSKEDKEDIENVLNNAVANNIYNPKEAANLKNKVIELAEKQLEKKEKVAEEILLQTQTKNEGDHLIRAINGNLTSTDIIASHKTENISLEIAKTAQTVMLSLDNVATRESDDNTFDKLVSDYLLLDSGDLEALRKFRIKIGIEYAAGNLTKEDALSFTNRTIDPLTNFDIKKKSKGLFASAISTIKNWAEITGAPKIVKTFMMKELMKRTQNGMITDENIDEKSQDIIEDAKKVINPNRTKYKVGDIVDTPIGPAKVIGFAEDGEPLLDSERIRELSK